MFNLIVFPITVYRYLGKQLGIKSACRFVPTCSLYTEEAIRRHGIIRGVVLGMKRIARCHPWNKGGLDSVPD